MNSGRGSPQPNDAHQFTDQSRLFNDDDTDGALDPERIFTGIPFNLETNFSGYINNLTDDLPPLPNVPPALPASFQQPAPRQMTNPILTPTQSSTITPHIETILTMRPPLAPPPPLPTTTQSIPNGTKRPYQSLSSTPLATSSLASTLPAANISPQFKLLSSDDLFDFMYKLEHNFSKKALNLLHKNKALSDYVLGRPVNFYCTGDVYKKFASIDERVRIFTLAVKNKSYELTNIQILNDKEILGAFYGIMPDKTGIVTEAILRQFYLAVEYENHFIYERMLTENNQLCHHVFGKNAHTQDEYQECLETFKSLMRAETNAKLIREHWDSSKIKSYCLGEIIQHEGEKSFCIPLAECWQVFEIAYRYGYVIIADAIYSNNMRFQQWISGLPVSDNNQTICMSPEEGFRKYYALYNEKYSADRTSNTFLKKLTQKSALFLSQILKQALKADTFSGVIIKAFKDAIAKKLILDVTQSSSTASSTSTMTHLTQGLGTFVRPHTMPKTSDTEALQPHITPSYGSKRIG